MIKTLKHNKYVRWLLMCVAVVLGATVFAFTGGNDKTARADGYPAPVMDLSEDFKTLTLHYPAGVTSATTGVLEVSITGADGTILKNGEPVSTFLNIVPPNYLTRSETYCTFRFLTHLNNTWKVSLLSGATYTVAVRIGVVGTSGFTEQGSLTFRYVEFTVPEDPVRTGYTFTGWFFDEACTQPYDNSPITAETTLYAGWQINRYTLTFVTSDPAVVVAPITVDYNITPTMPANPTRTGYTFKGWFTNSGLTAAYTNAPLTENKTLYASWEINKYTVRFEGNGGSATSNMTVNYNTVLTLPANPTRTGYTFAGWYKDSNLTNAYTPAAVKSDLTLYAKWTINKYTITFETNGGSAIPSASMNYGTVPTMPNDPTMTGFIFSGWYTDSALTKVYTPAAISENMTVYASWLIIRYNVTFIVDGEVYAEISVPHGSTLYETAQALKAATMANITIFEGENEDVITGDTKLIGTAVTTNNGKVIGHFQDNWVIYTIAGSIALALVCLAVGLRIKNNRGK